MEWLAQAKQHYTDQLDRGLVPLEVPEWGITIYYRRVRSLYDDDKHLRLADQNKPADALVQAFISHARDGDGRRLATDATRNELKRSVDREVLVRVVNTMLGEDFFDADREKDVDQAEGN